MVDPASQKCTPSPLQCNARQQQHTREAKVHFLDAGPPQEREGAPLVHLMFAPWCTRWHHDALFAAEPSDLWDAIIAVFLRFTSLFQEQFEVFAIQGRSESASLAPLNKSLNGGYWWIETEFTAYQAIQSTKSHQSNDRFPLYGQYFQANSECDNTIVIIML